MAQFSIESNGRIEKTVVYMNGEQLGGVKEIFLNLGEDGTFDSIIQYEGSDKNIYTKQIFTEYLENIKVVEPSLTDEEAEELQTLTIDSSGDIDNTRIVLDEDTLDGIVNLLVHIKGSSSTTGIKSLFHLKNIIPDHPEFKAEITFRNQDDNLQTEAIF